MSVEHIVGFLKRHKLYRFTLYSITGSFTFSIDLLLLFLLIDVLSINYLVATAVAFVIALTLHYLFSRRYAFRGTDQSHHRGYVLFFAIGSMGLLFVSTLMYVFVGILGVHYFLSRILVACMVSMWGYLMNYHFNFKVRD